MKWAKKVGIYANFTELTVHFQFPRVFQGGLWQPRDSGPADELRICVPDGWNQGQRAHGDVSVRRRLVPNPVPNLLSSEPPRDDGMGTGSHGSAVDVVTVTCREGFAGIQDAHIDWTD